MSVSTDVLDRRLSTHLRRQRVQTSLDWHIMSVVRRLHIIFGDWRFAMAGPRLWNSKLRWQCLRVQTAADDTPVWRPWHYVTFNDERHLEIILLPYFLTSLLSRCIHLFAVCVCVGDWQVERLVEMSSTCAIKEWRRLPMIVSQVHVNLLQVSYQRPTHIHTPVVHVV